MRCCRLTGSLCRTGRGSKGASHPEKLIYCRLHNSIVNICIVLNPGCRLYKWNFCFNPTHLPHLLWSNYNVQRKLERPSSGQTPLQRQTPEGSMCHLSFHSYSPCFLKSSMLESSTSSKTDQIQIQMENEMEANKLDEN